jgi:hypothetical protein
MVLLITGSLLMTEVETLEINCPADTEGTVGSSRLIEHGQDLIDQDGADGDDETFFGRQSINMDPNKKKIVGLVAVEDLTPGFVYQPTKIREFLVTDEGTVTTNTKET